VEKAEKEPTMDGFVLCNTYKKTLHIVPYIRKNRDDHKSKMVSSLQDFRESCIKNKNCPIGYFFKV